jgi:hypothetical protein
MMCVLRALLDEDDGNRNADRLARFVIEQALAGHFGYFRFLLNAVDGKIRPTSEKEGTFEANCVLVVADNGREADRLISGGVAA